ncbi:MAG TPA: response regulator [Planctomycetota bacterium]
MNRRAAVLIVDDHAANRLAYQAVLERDYAVFLADSGPRALDVARREELSVILLDIRMPEMDGFETATLLRRRYKTRYTPIVFMSAIHQTPTHVSQGFVVGATDYLFTPVDPDFLRFKVGVYAEMFRRNEALRLQAERLGQLIRSLRADFDSVPESQAKVRRLEGILSELQRQAAPN